MGWKVFPLSFFLLFALSCEESDRGVSRGIGVPTQLGNGDVQAEEPGYAAQRAEMVESQLRARGISDGSVLDAMGKIPRHLFVPELYWGQSYEDHPLPIGSGQTISQPYIVALMTESVKPGKGMKALDVGTGSGYQAAVLAELVSEVVSLEILCGLADEARARLGGMGYSNVEVRCCDGYMGAPDEAPFDIIVVAAAPDHVPKPLVEQLAPGGRMVIPVGRMDQELLLLEKSQAGAVTTTSLAPVIFVPMTGESEKKSP